MSLITRSQVLLAMGLVIAATGCLEEPISNLLTEGPPRVLSVTALVESSPTVYGEEPVFCSTDGAEKISLVACYDGNDESLLVGDDGLRDVQDVQPMAWTVRIVFNELLIGDRVETLVSTGQTNDFGEDIMRGTLTETQPVSLRCGDQDVAYDGYYSPAGNHLTTPPGPSLVVHLAAEDNFVATRTRCEISVDDTVVVDKDGNGLRSDTKGPYQFTIAPLTVAATDPAGSTGNPQEGVPVDVTPTVTFNAPIAEASFLDADDNSRFVLRKQEDGVPVAVTVTTFMDTSGPEPRMVLERVAIDPEADLEPNTLYELAVVSDVEDVKGGKLIIEELAPAEDIVDELNESGEVQRQLWLLTAFKTQE